MNYEKLFDPNTFVKKYQKYLNNEYFYKDFTTE